jgi:hypothetical protein
MFYHYARVVSRLVRVGQGSGKNPSIEFFYTLNQLLGINKDLPLKKDKTAGQPIAHRPPAARQITRLS